MATYEPLYHYLGRQSSSQIPMTFRQIAQLVGKLPPSAYRHRAWWANEAVGHSHAKAWLSAGYETAQVSMADGKLVFRRKTGGMSKPVRTFVPPTPDGIKTPRRSPLFGALRGTFTIEPGYDLTTPALESEAWENALDAKLAKFDTHRGGGRE